MLTFYKIGFIFLLYSFQGVFAVSQIKSSNDAESQLTYENRTIFSCGQEQSAKVYTSFGIALLLSIHNILSPSKVDLQTNWQAFSKVPDVTLPADMNKILEIAKVWNFRTRKKIFLTTKEKALETSRILAKTKQWADLPAAYRSKADLLTPDELSNYVQIVLEAIASQKEMKDQKILENITVRWIQ